jgi:hypothetical protein
MFFTINKVSYKIKFFTEARRGRQETRDERAEGLRKAIEDEKVRKDAGGSNQDTIKAAQDALNSLKSQS